METLFQQVHDNECVRPMLKPYKANVIHMALLFSKPRLQLQNKGIRERNNLYITYGQKWFLF